MAMPQHCTAYPIGSFIRNYLQPGSQAEETLVQFCSSLPHHERIIVTNGSGSTRSQIWVLVQLCDLVLASLSRSFFHQ